MYGDATIAGYIPASAFYPSPKVESAILSIQVHSEPKVPAEIIDSIFKIAKAGFSQKRKQLRNSMSAGLGLEAEQVEEVLRRIGIDPRLRAQELLLADWAAIARDLSHDSE
jgi:16S rRNA (adenine1518-N6/adenine1519-N6)-dimethyltransferase